MFQRIIQKELIDWKNNPNRKPMLLRGARQVGKTTVVDIFSKNYKQYLYLNLEKEGNAYFFERYAEVRELLEAVFFTYDKDLNEKSTLIFIDEIQKVPKAVEMLRYFYEEFPYLHIIAAGSLLETILNKRISIPVGRVEYRVLRPLSFPEFLIAMGETNALQQLENIPVKDFAHDKLMKLFHTYALIGGMPEVVANYAVNRNLSEIKNIYETLLVSYMDDVEKYARNDSLSHIIRHIIKNIYTEAGLRIKFQGFGHSNYGSREVGEAFFTIEKAFLLHLVYPTANTILPISPDRRKSPRLQILDTGLMNYFAGLQKEIIGSYELDKIYQGRVIEHLIGQEILASKFNVLNELHFWTREKKGSMAEVDYLMVYDSLIIPIEVKSGATGTLRSLHLFMEQSPHDIAVRLYGGKYYVDNVRTVSGKIFRLINLPYYLASQIESYLGFILNNLN